MMVCDAPHMFKPKYVCTKIKISLDYDMATQRMCIQRGPSDAEDRCAYTVYNYKKVYMCFCQGDLCNAADPAVSGLSLLPMAAIITFYTQKLVREKFNISH